MRSRCHGAQCIRNIISLEGFHIDLKCKKKHLQKSSELFKTLKTGVADPDPQDFGPLILIRMYELRKKIYKLKFKKMFFNTFFMLKSFSSSTSMDEKRTILETNSHSSTKGWTFVSWEILVIICPKKLPSFS